MNYIPTSNRQYFPVGNKILIQIQKDDDNGILIPDGVRKPEPPIGEILAVGELVNISTNEQVGAAMAKYNVGELIIFNLHGGFGISQDQQTLLIDRNDVVAKVVRQ